MCTSLLQCGTRTRVGSVKSRTPYTKRTLAALTPSNASVEPVSEPPMLRKLRSDLKGAMKAKDNTRYDSLRLVSETL